MVKKPF
jgi:hypothetical protein